MLGTIALIALGAMLVGTVYWDRIKNWLQTTVADKLEQHFGYKAKQNLYKIVSIADRVVGGIRNRAIVYIKEGRGYKKMTIERIDDVIDVEEDLKKEIAEKGSVMQEYEGLEM